MLVRRGDRCYWYESESRSASYSFRLAPARERCDKSFHTSAAASSSLRSPSLRGGIPVKSRTRLSLETLEDRCTPAAIVTIGHNLWITGTDAADTVTVSNTTVGTTPSVQVTEQSGTGAVKTTTFAKSALPGGYVFFFGYAGEDRFTNRSSLLVIAHAGSGNNTFTSTTAGFFYGGAGRSVVDFSAASGTVVVQGGAGSDTIYGGTGTNFLDGGAGANIIVANPQSVANYINGGAGDDKLYGGGGLNIIHGGAGNDTIYGGTGKNYLFGDAGVDMLLGNAASSMNYLDGGEGNDTLKAGGGINYLYGGAGNDTLIGGGGTNYLFGGAGGDTLYGGSGFNVLDGGEDSTTDYLIGGTGHNQFYRNTFFNGTTYIVRAVLSNYDATRDTLYG